MASVTPPRNNSLSQFDPPAGVKEVSGASYAASGLEERREALMDDLGESIPQYKAQEFIENVLPPLRDGLDVTRVVAALQTGSDPVINHDGRWRWFEKDPARMNMNENAAFKPLEELANEIATASGLKDMYRLLDFNNNPNATPKSENRESSSRPDGYFVLRHKPGEGGCARWSDVSLSAEYKRHSNQENRYDDVVKVVWSMHHCMREDPCRRFTYGLTIENTDMRLWFCSRSGPIVSESFNFTTEHRKVVEVFLRFMYAKKHEVGWDPTVERVRGDENTQKGGNAQPQYDYAVRNKDGVTTTYRTIEIISDVGANLLRGRGTRVWKAKKLVNKGECDDFVALKDCWIDSDRDREGDIVEELRASDPLPGEEVPFKDYLLTVLCHGDVHIPDQGDQVDDTVVARPSATGTGDHVSVGEHNAHVSKSLPTYAYRAKTHYRIVFKEVCTPMKDLTTMNKILPLLAQTEYALRGLHRREWVHRDISTGNLLVHDNKIKLSDLEYTRKMNAQTMHDIRTGTADFMAVEVYARGYQFLPIRNLRNTNYPDATVPFRYNPLHDLESVWWVAVYFVFNKRVVRAGDATISRGNKSQHKFAEGLFFFDRAKRYATLCQPGNLDNATLTLDQSLFEASTYLSDMRRDLMDRYQNIERDLAAISHTAAKDLHEAFATYFHSMAATLQGDVIMDVYDNNGKEKAVEKTHVSGPGPSDKIKNRQSGHDEGSNSRRMDDVFGGSDCAAPGRTDDQESKGVKRSNASIAESEPATKRKAKI